jgi:hypothetical protein
MYVAAKYAGACGDTYLAYFVPERSPPVKQPPDFRIGSLLKRTRLVFARNFFNLAGIAGIAVMPGFIVPAARYD